MSQSPTSDQAFSLPQGISAEALSGMEVAALVSAGVESAVMLGALSPVVKRMHPIYLKFGLRWEECEIKQLRQFLQAIESYCLAPLSVLSLPMTDVYQGHWSTEGESVPLSGTPDEAVFLPGRNLLMLAKTAVWCSLNNVQVVALGSLVSNPFPDATDDFFDGMQALMGQALDGRTIVWRPFAKMHKEDVVKLGADLPLELSQSCLQPATRVDGETTVQCGHCNKCEERRSAFVRAGVEDKTVYARQRVPLTP
ncbi:MAG TPA: 7-cyano-7-deazaguanine synthase [Planktothrix sp.]